MGESSQPSGEKTTNTTQDAKPGSVDPPEGFDISNLSLFLFPSLPRGRLPKFPWLSDCGGICGGSKTPSQPPPPGKVESLPPSPRSSLEKTERGDGVESEKRDIGRFEDAGKGKTKGTVCVFRSRIVTRSRAKVDGDAETG